MSWQKGYEAAASAASAYYSGEDTGPRRVWMPGGAEQTFLFLDSDPVVLWEHQFKIGDNWRNYAPCLKRNRIAETCYLCDRYKDKYPHFIGFHSVINMTPWTSKKGREYCFNRELFAAKMGSKDKPGSLKRLERIKKHQGRLRGVIINVTRLGDKSEVCGDEFNVMDKIAEDKIEEFARTKLMEWAEHVNQSLPVEKQTSVEQLWKRSPWEPFDYDAVIVVKTNNELREMFAGDGRDKEDDDDAPDAAGGAGTTSKADDDCPF